VDTLSEGEIGYIVTGIKNPDNVRIGDTVFHQPQAPHYQLHPLPGYRRPQPVLWASLYPEDERAYEALRDALGRLRLNDASLTYEPESSPVLGRSFLCGFLGMLHLEIVTERLKREFSVSVVVTSPSIAYEVTKRNGEIERISSASKFPPASEIQHIQEPWMSAEIIVPEQFLGDVLQLVDAYEGIVLSSEQFGLTNQAENVRIKLHVEMPLREVVSDFFDALKSATSGYASLSYAPCGVREADVERIDILVAEEPVPALSRIVSKEKSQTIARSLVTALKDVLPRQLFLVKIQAVIGGRIVASESISALKKDVTGYLYG
ncbi:MAG: elongation factor 4, partial [Patescibacteria group bacterium]